MLLLFLNSDLSEECEFNKRRVRLQTDVHLTETVFTPAWDTKIVRLDKKAKNYTILNR